MKISKILLSVAVAFSLGNAITLTPDDEAMINDNKKIISELKNINSDSEIFNRTISGVIKAKEEMIKLKLESKGEDYV
ncbi:MAG: hypothetical protein J6M21_04020 [Campylobacter sp.]|nr:hypothetical protein [Campylobacter sp.]